MSDGFILSIIFINQFNSMNKYRKLTITILILTLFFIVKPNNVFSALDSTGYAISTSLNEGVDTSDIICSYEEGFIKCKEEYDTAIFGIVVENPSVSVEDTEGENSRLVISRGVAKAKVSTVNGNIKDGDLITSSKKAGIGMKAVRNGYVLGRAMESYESADTNSVGVIQIALNIHPASRFAQGGSNLLQYIRQGIAVPLYEPLASLRYILAVIMVILSFTLGMMYFGRASRAGIEAVGRNPLAKRVIQMTVVLNIILTIVIVGVGLAIAYLVLVI